MAVYSNLGNTIDNGTNNIEYQAQSLTNCCDYKICNNIHFSTLTIESTNNTVNDMN